MEQALREACVRYGTSVSNLVVLSQTQHSLIGAYIHGDYERILRLTKDSHRPFEAIQGEVDWINYLFQKGISVSCPVTSLSGQFAEKINLDNEYVTAVSFVRAEGSSPTEEDLSNSDDLVQAMGRFMGKMHSATKGYLPKKINAKRPQWFEDANRVASINLPNSETEVLQEYVELNQSLAQFPVDTDSYGLVHMDFHSGNFFFDRAKITAFDFDACRYSWFVNDIAVALFYAIPLHLSAETKISHGKRFFTHFMEGYGKENNLNRGWFNSMQAFIRHREIGRYIKIWRSCNGDVESLTGWNKDFMINRKDYILGKIPFIDINFANL